MYSWYDHLFWIIDLTKKIIILKNKKKTFQINFKTIKIVYYIKPNFNMINIYFQQVEATFIYF